MAGDFERVFLAIPRWGKGILVLPTGYGPAQFQQKGACPAAQPISSRAQFPERAVFVEGQTGQRTFTLRKCPVCPVLQTHPVSEASLLSLTQLDYGPCRFPSGPKCPDVRFVSTAGWSFR
jgi:hypothetical protein